jgi:adenosylcobinamide kinase/adenosylcobinamide-phosphate guanylyltransferase
MEEGKEKRMVLVIGGARSGKSAFAQRLARGTGERVCYLATAEAGDEEMFKRIQFHRMNRPQSWTTLEIGAGEIPLSVPDVYKVALLDCFTVYLSNLMALRGLDWPPEEEHIMPEEEVIERMEQVEKEALAQVRALKESLDTLIIVSNEVGWGLVPPFRLGRIFRDLAGRLNQRLVA